MQGAGVRGGQGSVVVLSGPTSEGMAGPPMHAALTTVCGHHMLSTVCGHPMLATVCGHHMLATVCGHHMFNGICLDTTHTHSSGCSWLDVACCSCCCHARGQ